MAQSDEALEVMPGSVAQQLQRRRAPVVTVATGVLLALFPADVHAYVDPGSGFLLWQLIGSFVLGLAFYFRRVLALLKTLLSGKRDNQQP